MSGGLFDSGRLAIRIGLLAVFAGGLSVGCSTSPGPAVSPVPGVSEAAVCPEKGPPTNVAELRACVAKISFDTTDLVGDEQRLMVNPPCPASCRYGPLAKIEPAQGAHQYTPGQLRQGRIIARLSVRSGEKGYEKLALVAGYPTYWWVQRDAAEGGRSLFISEATVGTRLVTQARALQVEEYPEGAFTRAIAGWVWLDQDETAKGTCGSASCK